MGKGGKRLAAVLALLLAGGVLLYVSFGGIEENLVYYWSPAELLERGRVAYGATVRLGGVVEQGSMAWDPAALDLRFNLSVGPEPGSPSVPVKANAAPPQMFREGIGAVVEGSYDGHVFQASRVMVKHSNEYRPPAAGERPEDIYTTLLPEQ